MTAPDRVFYVYEHIRADTGEVFYVGKGKGRRAHAKNPCHRSKWWARIAAKSGGVEVAFFAKELTEAEAFEIERRRIAELRGQGVILCNLTDGGDGASGHKRSPEWCQMMSRVHKGKVLSEETRHKVSEGVKASGYIPSEEARRKMSETHKGHKRSLGYRHTPEWRQAASERSKGNKGRSGQTRSLEERAKASAALSGRVQTIQTCPHCQKTGGNVMRRHHFDNCKVRAHDSI